MLASFGRELIKQRSEFQHFPEVKILGQHTDSLPSGNTLTHSLITENKFWFGVACAVRIRGGTFMQIWKNTRARKQKSNMPSQSSGIYVQVTTTYWRDKKRNAELQSLYFYNQRSEASWEQIWNGEWGNHLHNAGKNTKFFSRADKSEQEYKE